MCGADYFNYTYNLSELGSPPRVRSRRAEQAANIVASGITSACAEQTRASTQSNFS